MQAFHFDLSTKSIAPVLNVKQGDVGRKFQAVITDRGVDYNIPAGAQFSVWFSGPSGEGNYSAIGERSAFTVDGNTVTVELIAQMLQNPGTGAMCLVLNAVDGSQIGLWNVIYSVEAVPGMGSKTAQEYYTALSELARQAIEAAATFETDTTLFVSGKAADAAATGAALAGKAPAGYGYGGASIRLGVDSVYLRSDTELEAVLEPIYSAMGSAETKLIRFVGYPDNSDYSWFGILSKSSANYGSLFAHSAYGKGHMISKARVAGTWQPLEWFNPPMTLGVEYRTTERHNGKAVYAKAIDFGALPNATGKLVEFCAEGATAVCDLKLNLSDGYLLSAGYGIDKRAQSSFGIHLGNTLTKVQVITEGNYSNLTAYATIKYTKD